MVTRPGAEPGEITLRPTNKAEFEPIVLNPDDEVAIVAELVVVLT